MIYYLQIHHVRHLMRTSYKMDYQSLFQVFLKMLVKLCSIIIIMIQMRNIQI